MTVSGSIDIINEETTHNGMQTVSKTVALKGVADSISAVSAQYRMNMRAHNGEIRADLPKGLIYDMSGKWGDIMLCISANKWMTQEEVVQAVWDREKRSYIKSYTRSRKQVEEALRDLVEAQFVLIK